MPPAEIARPSTVAFSGSSITLAPPAYNDILLARLNGSRTRWFDAPAKKRRDPRPVTMRLDAEDVNEETWRQIKLIAWKADENTVEASLLRPLWWIEETGAKPGTMIHLAMQDFGLVGPTKVLAINPCPKLEDGAGNFVIGKFKHSANMLLHIYFEGLDKPLEVTPNHPLYSLDRDEYVVAGKLRIGERLKTRKGVLAKIAKVNVAFGTQYVYNLEVHRAHRYFVSKLGIMTHNSYEITAKQEGEIDQYLESKGMTAVKNPNEAQGSGDRFVDGQPTEYKTVNGVQNPNIDTISGAISNRAMNARSQAPNVVIDIRGQAGATEEAAVKGAVRAFGADRATAARAGTAPKLTSIRIIFLDSFGNATDQIYYPTTN